MTNHARIVLRAAPNIQPEPPDWFAAAECLTTDPELFHPEKGGSPEAAKKICRQCDVRAECLVYALDNDERFGVYGGLTEKERRRLRPGWKRGDPLPPITEARSQDPGFCPDCGKKCASVYLHRKHVGPHTTRNSA